jgi:hypothetical protein
VDATYRSELREINELNFARFAAKLELGLGTLEARVNERLAMLEAKLERRLAEQTRWFFIAWASLLVTLIGLSLRR